MNSHPFSAYTLPPFCGFQQEGIRQLIIRQSDFGMELGQSTGIKEVHAIQVGATDPAVSHNRVKPESEIWKVALEAAGGTMGTGPSPCS